MARLDNITKFIFGLFTLAFQGSGDEFTVQQAWQETAEEEGDDIDATREVTFQKDGQDVPGDTPVEAGATYQVTVKSSKNG